MSRAMGLAVLAFGLAAGAAHAQGAAAYGYAPGGDRYGAAPAAYAPPGAYGPAQPGPALRPPSRMLAWPGKTQTSLVAAYAGPPNDPSSPVYGRAIQPPAPARRTAYAPRAAFRPASAYPGMDAYAGQVVAPTRAPYAPGPEAASQGWRAVPLDAAQPVLAGAPLPTSIYDRGGGQGARAAAAPPPVRTASADRRYGYDPAAAHTVRFYSVHRPFGLQPDPAPIPPQFFTNTADLAQPPGPLPEERVAAGASGTSRTARAAPDTSTGQ